MSPIWLVIHPEAELGELMRAYGAPAEIATSLTVAEALNACCALEPACVVASAKLSAKDARWIVSAIRGQAEIASVPIVVLSEGDERSRVALLKMGADVILPAPISTAGILASVEALMSLCDRTREGTLLQRESPRSAMPTTRRPGVNEQPEDRSWIKTVIPPAPRRPTGDKPTMRAGLAALKPLVLGPDTPMQGMHLKPIRRETLLSQPVPESARGKVPDIPVETPKQLWLPPKTATAPESNSTENVSAHSEPSTRRPR